MQQGGNFGFLAARDSHLARLFKQWGEWDDGSGNPEAEEVENDSEYAHAVYTSAIHPAFISQDGRVFARADLPEELPCRLVERVYTAAADQEELCPQRRKACLERVYTAAADQEELADVALGATITRFSSPE